jgi:two-component system sensor histidine kinase PilS (NtrC family)
MKSTRAPGPTSHAGTLADSGVNGNLRRMLLMRLLVTVAVFVLGPLFFRTYAPSLYLFTGALFSLTLIYVLLLEWGFDPELFANVQIFADVFLVTLLVALSGWEKSIFGFLYIIPITTASLFFHRRQTISIALLSSMLYSALVLFHRYHLSPGERAGDLEIFYSLYIRAIIFCMVGYLCGYLANLLRKEKEELRELRNLHEHVVSSMNSGLITTDTSSAIVYANRAAEKILGVPSKMMYNRNLTEFFADGQEGALKEALDNPRERKGDAGIRERELLARNAEGKDIPVGFNLSTILDRSGKPVGKVMVFSDLTEVKELEKRLRAIDRFRTAGELAAGIAHEIRNPLTSIGGSIEMLAESPGLSESNKELLSVVLRESARLNRIIEDFLAYARKGNLDMKKENLREIIREAIEMLGRGGKLPADVRVELVTPEEPPIVSADRCQMGQVFLNLLSNAVEAMEGSGTIYINLESSPADTDSYIVTVADTGRGMSPQTLSKVFEPFFTTKKGGVGIGLCIAEKIVREHNGRIEITSEEGKGSTVALVVPKGQGVGKAPGLTTTPEGVADAVRQETRSDKTPADILVGEAPLASES